MNILLVDDDPVTRKVMGINLKKWGHTVVEADNGQTAWDHIQADPVEMVITDWMMPIMDGIALCQNIRNGRFAHYIYLIVVSALDSKPDVVHGLEAGIDDYLIKPVDMDMLKARIAIGNRIICLEQNLVGQFDTIQKNYFQTIRMIAQLIEVFDEELGGHCRRVGRMALQMAKRHKDIAKSDWPVVEAAGLLHDIGLIGLPKEILVKHETEMTGDEKHLYRTHPVQGEMILKRIEYLLPISRLVRHHHEQINGKGYPDGLKGDDIPLLARIISACSIYDSLVHKWKIPPENMPERLRVMAGYRIEHALIEHLLAMHKAAIESEKNSSFQQVKVENLREGMILAKSIRRNNGALIIPRETELNGFIIEKLRRFIQIASIQDRVVIYKSANEDNVIRSL
ncbi:MAG: HD domain-containing phosphohydrolase [Desulfatirhabdiaceae bacterium]